MRKMRKYRDYLIEELSDREEAISYLQIAVEEYLKDGDTLALMLALQSVAEAQGELSKKQRAEELLAQAKNGYYNRDLTDGDKRELDHAIADFAKTMARDLNCDLMGLQSERVPLNALHK